MKRVVIGMYDLDLATDRATTHPPVAYVYRAQLWPHIDGLFFKRFQRIVIMIPKRRKRFTVEI